MSNRLKVRSNEQESSSTLIEFELWTGSNFDESNWCEFVRVWPVININDWSALILFCLVQTLAFQYFSSGI